MTIDCTKYCRNALAGAAMAGLLALAPTAVLAATTTFDASVEVASDFTLTQAQAISFGQVAIQAAPADGDLIVLPSDGSTMTVPTGVIIVQNGTPGQLTISGAAASTALTPTAIVVGDDNRLTQFGQEDYFIIHSLTFDNAPTTDATGNLTLNFGATLEITDEPANAGVALGDGTYTGTFPVTFNY